ncbi:MAG: SH3 domain-containing protein [Anaerolineae bacterium]|nr:SH3 domain-containing protein [Anaerolineae bacterium]
MVKRFFVLLFMSVPGMVAVQAQDVAVIPVIALAKGEFWAINPDDGSLRQITHYDDSLYYAQPGFQRDLAISPHGRYLAYLKTPRFFAIAMKNNLLGNMGWTPSDVVLLNLSTGEEQVIAAQQPNVTYSDSVRLWYRWHLTWSPDGSQLAYYQYRGNQGETHFQSEMMIYDLQSGQTVKVVESSDYMGNLSWLREGYHVDAATYDADGNLITRHYLNDGMIVAQPLVYQGVEYVIVDSADVSMPNREYVYLMNVQTGAYSVVDGYQSSVSATATDGSLVFIGDTNDTRPWYVIDPQSGAIYNPPASAPYAVDFAISPDGKQFAYVLIGTNIHISDLKGKDLVIDLAANIIVWGSKRYTIASREGRQDMPVTPTTDFDTPQRCGKLAPVGLVAGGRGRVIAGSVANRIRSSPDTEAGVIGQIPAGEVFALVDGQQGVCSGGIRWAQVSYDGVTGWTAEGVGVQVFLEVVG